MILNQPLIKSTIKKETKAVVADRAMIDDIRDCIFNIASIIPVKSNSKSNNDTLDWYLYRCRHL